MNSISRLALAGLFAMLLASPEVPAHAMPAARAAESTEKLAPTLILAQPEAHRGAAASRRAARVRPPRIRPSSIWPPRLRCPWLSRLGQTLSMGSRRSHRGRIRHRRPHRRCGGVLGSASARTRHVLVLYRSEPTGWILGLLPVTAGSRSTVRRRRSPRMFAINFFLGKGRRSALRRGALETIDRDPRASVH